MLLSESTTNSASGRFQDYIDSRYTALRRSEKLQEYGGFNSASRRASEKPNCMSVIRTIRTVPHTSSISIQKT